MIYAYSKSTGLLKWSKSLNQLTGTGAYGGTTPVRYLNSFLIGLYGAPYVARIDIATGNLIGKVKIGTHTLTTIRMSGTVFGNILFWTKNENKEGKRSNGDY